MSNKIEEEKPVENKQPPQKIYEEDDDDFEEFEQEGMNAIKYLQIQKTFMEMIGKLILSNGVKIGTMKI